MSSEDFESLRSKVTDLNQRMCRIEKRTDLVDEQISTISENLSSLASQSVKGQKFCACRMLYIVAAITVLMTITLVILNLVT